MGVSYPERNLSSMKQRLDRTIAAQNTLSRSEVKALIRKKQVLVNGVPARTADQTVDWDTDTVTVCGKPLVLRQHLYLMLHKPQGVVSATDDPRFPTVVDLVPPEFARKGLFPAGRLDKDTTGFVLITDDGDFAHRILSPKRHVPKTYLATVNGTIGPETIQAFARGIDLHGDGPTLPARLEVAEHRPEGDVGRVVLREGMYHQIKRMFAACSLTVTALHRVRMGSLYLDPALPEGACRELTPQELELIQRPEPEEDAPHGV